MPSSHKPQVVQNEVLARTLAKQSKSQIAREMGIDRQTVTRIQECHNLPQLLMESRQYIVEKVVPDAIHSLHAQIRDRDAAGDGDLAVRLLEKSGVLGGEQRGAYTPSPAITNAIQVLLAPTIQPRQLEQTIGEAQAQANVIDAAPPAPAQAEPAARETCPNCGYDGASIYSGHAPGAVYEEHRYEDGSPGESCKRCHAKRAAAPPEPIADERIVQAQHAALERLRERLEQEQEQHRTAAKGEMRFR